MWDVQGYLDQLDIAYRVSGENLSIQCLWHNDKTPSLSIRLDGRAFYCFGCGEKGDFSQIVKKLTPDINLVEFIDTNTDKKVFTKKSSGSYIEHLVKLEDVYKAQFSLYNQEPDLIFSYLDDLMAEVSIRAGARIDEYNYSINFPVYYFVKELGRDVLIEIQKRNLQMSDFEYLGLPVPDKFRNVLRPKWQISKSFKKSMYLYGATEEYLDKPYEAVAIVEGIKDANIGRYFFPEYLWISTFGSKLSETQAGLIKKISKGRPVIMGYDNDEAGHEGTKKAISILAGDVLLRRFELLNNKKDIGEIQSEQDVKIVDYIWFGP